MESTAVKGLQFSVGVATLLLAMCSPYTTSTASANGCCYYESTCEVYDRCFLDCDPEGEGGECEIIRQCEGGAMVFYECAGSELACTTPSQGDPTWVPCPNGFVYSEGICTDTPNEEDEDCSDTINECTNIDCPAQCEYGYQFCNSGGPCGC